MADQRIREVAREEISRYDFSRRVSDLIVDSNYRLKQDIISHCDLKIENSVLGKLDSQRRDIFQTIRDIAKNDPIIIRNIEQISDEFKKKFVDHCSIEITSAKTAISSHLRSEVTRIGSIEPYQHIVTQMQEDTRKQIRAMQTQTNWMIGGLALINVGLLAYISRR